MKKIILALCILLLAGPVAAYDFTLHCPSPVQSGTPITCTVDSTNLPPGTSFNLVLYQAQYTSTEIKNQPVTIQPSHETQTFLFDTTGLPGGQYKVEAQFSNGELDKLQSDSITDELITLIDRSGDITITSPTTQDLATALRVEGSIANEASNGVQIEVRGQNSGTVFGPQWIGTKTDMRNQAGVFTQLVPVNGAGDYDVYFTDSQGFIGKVTFHVTAPATQVVTTIPVTTVPVMTTALPQTMPTPWPTATKSPLSPLTVIGALTIAGLFSMTAMKKKRL
jgi:hypothetical protein